MTNTLERQGGPHQMSEADWKNLYYTIQDGMCTPFLGAGACHGSLPSGKEIAQKWARTLDYPFIDVDVLPRVAEYYAVQNGAASLPKREMIDIIRSASAPDFDLQTEIHGTIADLHLPLYITTNYDAFMWQALKRNEKKSPRQEVCRWWDDAGADDTPPAPGAKPLPKAPVVYHLHGIVEEWKSLVLTQDDYLQFIVALSEDADLIPPYVKRSFTQSSLLFLGYSMEDLTFKVLFKRLAPYFKMNGEIHVSVQLRPALGDNPSPVEIERSNRMCEFIENQYGRQIKVFWGTCASFSAKMWEMGLPRGVRTELNP